MKTKVLLSSIVTIVLCVCLIAGSTFALFTSEDSWNIEVTSGEVSIDAGIDNIIHWSIEPTEGGSIEDEFGGTYEYVEQTDDEFYNTGKAVFANNLLTIDRVTPGDKLSFDITASNTGNVTVIVRYIIQYIPDATLEAKSEAPLYYAMSMNIGGTEYAGVTYYASAWEVVAAGSDMTAAAIEIGLPTKVGNTYQHGAANYSVTVQAIQSNADVDLNEVILVQEVNSVDGLYGALENGGEVKINENIDDVLVFDENTNGQLNLEGNTLSNNVFNSGDITISGGDINVNNGTGNSCGFQNNGGNAVIEDVTMNAGDSNDYSNISHGGSVVYNNVNITANGGGIGVTGGYAEYNSGTFEMVTTTTNPRYMFYVVGDGTELVINGGDFSFSNIYNKRAYIYVDTGATVTINGGNFGEACQHPSSTYNNKAFLGNGTIIITGGTFGFDPSAWVATGYVAVEDSGVWTVVAE